MGSNSIFGFLKSVPRVGKSGRILPVLMIGVLMELPMMNGQQTVFHEAVDKDFQALLKEYDQGLYGRAARSSENFIHQHQDPAYAARTTEAELVQLRSWLRMDHPAAIQQIMAFAEKHHPDPISQKAIMMVGEYAYEQKNYDEAIKYLSLVNPQILPVSDQTALNFKLGYSLFVRQEFNQAAGLFNQTRTVPDIYYYPSNYYYGMCQYFLGNYPEAVSSFERVAPSEYYRDFIPYYIIQIHFNNRDFENVIGYGNYAIANSSVQNLPEIRHLIGQAYYESGDFNAAIPHLEYYEQNTQKLHPDDFYQLGMAYYQAGRFEEAIPVLLEIRNEPGTKAQYANYYLAQSYLKTGDKVSARNSLRNVMMLDEVPALKMEATYHYGKLSAEAGDDMEAIRVLQTIPSSSPDYKDAQNALVQIVINTGDYSLAIRELESMGNLTPALKTAYQKVTLFKAEQLMQEGKVEEAGIFLDKSLKNPSDKTFEARAFFWKGELAHQEGKYEESIRFYNRYFTIGGKMSDLPSHQSAGVAHYNQGYNYYRLPDHGEALKQFEAAVNDLRSNGFYSSDFLKTQLYPDAHLRAGDASFKLNQYEKAIQHYDRVIEIRSPGNDYAVYQKAMIRGLQGKPREKIDLLESIANKMPASLWADDALFRAGTTYQEENDMMNAIRSFERIVNLEPRSALLHPALLRLGLISYNGGKFDAALKYYKSIFQYNPDPQTSKEAMSAIQEIYVNELDQPEAFFAFAGSIPGFSVSRLERDSILYTAAENHYALGEYEKAAVSFKKYLDENPGGVYSLKAKYLRAESLTLVKKWDEALKAYESLIKDGQSIYYSQALYKAALISYNQMEDMPRSYKYYKDYIPLAESDEKQFEAILGALRSAYKFKDGEGVYTMTAQLVSHPRATDDLRTLAHYYSASTALADEDYDKAIASYNDVISISSAESAAESRYSVAFIHYKKGETDLAEKLAEESARSNVGYPFWVAKSLLLLSDIKYGKGDLLNSKAIIEAILESFKGDELIIREATERLHKIREAEKTGSRVADDQGDTLEMQKPPKKN